MPFKQRIKASKLAGLSIRAMIALDKMGEKSFELMRNRVRSTGTSEDGQALPPYRVKVAKKLAAWRTKGQTQRGKRHVSKGPWDEAKKGPPPDVFQQLRALGGVNKPGTDWKGGRPIFYGGGERTYTRRGKTYTRQTVSAVRAKSGQQWGVHWDTREEFLRDNYGGTQVDIENTGSMWNSPSIKVRPGRPGVNPSVEIGFKGSASGSIWAQLKAKKSRDREAAEGGKKPRKVSAAQKALLANSRGPDGKLTTSNPVEWLGMTESEMLETIKVLDKNLMDEIDRIPVEVNIIS